MGGLNANIIFQAAQQPQINDFGKMYQAAQQQKQQQAMQAAALQSQQLEAQQKQIELQNAQANQVQQQGVLQALQGSQGDVNAAIEILKKQGNPQYLALEKHKAEAEKETLANKKVMDELAKSQAEQQATKLGHIASLTSGIEDLPEALQGTAYQARRALAIQAGYATPETLPADWNPQTAQIVKGFQQNAITAKDQIDLKLKAQQQAQQAINQDRSFGETQRHNVTTEGLTATGQQQQAAYQNAQLGQGQARLQLEAKRVGLEGQRVGLEGQRLKQQAVADDPVSALSQGELEMAKAMASGEKKLLPQSARTGRNKIINEAAYMIAQQNGVPLTDELYKTHQDYMSSTGQANQRLKSTARVMGHLEDFDQNNEKLGTSLLDAVGIHGKTSNQVNLQKDVTAIAEEWKTLIKGNASLEAHRELLDGLQSPYKGVRQAAANEIKRLMSEQFRADNQAYKTGTGKELPVDRIYDPTTQQRLAKAGYLPNQMNPQGGSSSGGPAGVPSVGGVFNGEKVLKVTRIK